MRANLERADVDRAPACVLAEVGPSTLLVVRQLYDPRTRIAVSGAGMPGLGPTVSPKPGRDGGCCDAIEQRLGITAMSPAPASRCGDAALPLTGRAPPTFTPNAISASARGRALGRDFGIGARHRPHCLTGSVGAGVKLAGEWP